MHTGMLHTHVLSVTLFLIIYLVKAYYLLTDRKKELGKFSKWTKIPEMVISFIFLATGVYLTTQVEKIETWLIVKIIVVLASIPLAIVGIKKENKAAMAASVGLLLYAFGVAESKSLTFTKPAFENVVTDPQSPSYDAMKHGAAIYQVNCERCHGVDGNAGLQGAPDLTKSQMSFEQKAMIITLGKSVMPSYQNMLSKPGEIAAVTTFVESLKK